MVPSIVDVAMTRDQAAGGGMDQPNCATELLNSRGANNWSATLVKLLQPHPKHEQTSRRHPFENTAHHWLMSKRHQASALKGRPTAEATEFKTGMRQAFACTAHSTVYKNFDCEPVASISSTCTAAGLKTPQCTGHLPSHTPTHNLPREHAVGGGEYLLGATLTPL